MPDVFGELVVQLREGLLVDLFHLDGKEDGLLIRTDQLHPALLPLFGSRDLPVERLAEGTSGADLDQLILHPIPDDGDPPGVNPLEVHLDHIPLTSRTVDHLDLSMPISQMGDPGLHLLLARPVYGPGDPKIVVPDHLDVRPQLHRGGEVKRFSGLVVHILDLGLRQRETSLLIYSLLIQFRHQLRKHFVLQSLSKTGLDQTHGHSPFPETRNLKLLAIFPGRCVYLLFDSFRRGFHVDLALDAVQSVNPDL